MSRITLSWVLPALAMIPLCATVPAAASSKADPRLDGTWKIENATSDDFDAKLQRMAEEMRARRRNQRGAPGSAGGDSGEAGSYESRMVPGLMEELPTESRDELRERLDENFRPPGQLRIQTRGDEIVMQGDARPERRFNLREKVTRMDVSGTSAISARWAGASLVVDSRYTNRAHSEHKFTVDQTGGLLNVVVQFTDARGGKLQLHSSYRRVAP